MHNRTPLELTPCAYGVYNSCTNLRTTRLVLNKHPVGRISVVTISRFYTSLYTYFIHILAQRVGNFTSVFWGLCTVYTGLITKTTKYISIINIGVRPE